MKALIAEGKTVEEALQNAMLKLGASPSQIEYKILQEDNKGVFGLFGKPAVIRAWLKPVEEDRSPVRAPVRSAPPRYEHSRPRVEKPRFPKPPDTASTDATEQEDKVGDRIQHHLVEIVQRMGFTPYVQYGRRNGVYFFDIEVQEHNQSALLIGKRGQTLGALQHVLNRLISLENASGDIQIVLDVSGYRYKRDNFLKSKAQSLANVVKNSGDEVVMSPLHSSDRRVVHATLSEDPHIRTYTVGEGLYRSIVIAPNRHQGGRREEYQGGRREEYHRRRSHE